MGPSRVASSIYTPTMKTTIDWRLEICHFLRLDPIVSDGEVFHELQTASARMKEAERMEQNPTTDEDPLRCQVIHRVFCAAIGERTIYLDQPQRVHSGPHNSHLVGAKKISHVKLYLERHKNVIFLVHRDYTCCGQRTQPMNRSFPGKERDLVSEPVVLREQIKIVSNDLQSILGSLSDAVFRGIPHPKFGQMDDEYDVIGSESSDGYESSDCNVRDNSDVSYPYLWFYHRRDKIQETPLEGTDEEHLSVFCEYIQTRMGREWDAVDKLISNNEIAAEYISYIYVSF